MVKFVEVDPKDVPNVRQGRRGRVSYPILKGFLEQNKPVMMLDRDGMQQSFQSLYACLKNYASSHEMPINIFARTGEIYLARTDMDDAGNLIEDEGLDDDIEEEAPMIDADEVERRGLQEAGQTTK